HAIRPLHSIRLVSFVVRVARFTRVHEFSAASRLSPIAITADPSRHFPVDSEIQREQVSKPKQGTTQIKDQTLKIDFEEGIATAEIVNFFNDLFDSVNGVNSVNSVTVDNNLQSPVTEESVHHEFWANAKNVLRNMTFIDKVTHKIQKNVPSLKNWLFTINGFQKIWNILNKKYDFRFFNTRFCNQDPLENLFGQIRSHGVRNVNPTSRQFEDSFITLLVSNMKSFSIKGGNCETVHDSFMLFSLEKYLEDNLSNAEVYDVSCENNDEHDEPHELISNVTVHEESTVDFVSEYLQEIITAILKQFNYCKECNTCLTYSEFPIFVKHILSRLNKLLQTRAHRRDILKILLEHFDNWYVKIDWYDCVEHHNNAFKTMIRVITCKFLIWWCKKKIYLYIVLMMKIPFLIVYRTL
ncbi:uncharacterized protein, partial [Temnothorax longispinosus]|uniref:uncharacterized protein n=1 Tax=Temnothorax longispinosus TaxID=300112 RepID=UPI003A99C2A4